VAERLRLTARTPSETLIEAEDVEWVHVALAGDRLLTIWPGHAPLMGETVLASVRYVDATGQHEMDLLPGILHVREDVVTFLLAGAVGEGREDESQPSPGEDSTRLDRLIGTISCGQPLAKVP
jgi:F0F1-type ATP synthase epsilon subunit